MRQADPRALLLAACADYNCCGEEDYGWGCAYRAVQTVTSCLCARMPRMRTAIIPNVLELQFELSRLGAIPVSDVGSQRWVDALLHMFTLGPV